MKVETAVLRVELPEMHLEPCIRFELQTRNVLSKRGLRENAVLPGRAMSGAPRARYK